MWYLVDDGNKLVNVERCRVMNLLESSELVWNNDLSQRILRTSLSFPAHWVALYSTSEAALNLLCASKQWLSCCCVESLPRNSPLLSGGVVTLCKCLISCSCVPSRLLTAYSISLWVHHDLLLRQAKSWFLSCASTSRWQHPGIWIVYACGKSSWLSTPSGLPN